LLDRLDCRSLLGKHGKTRGRRTEKRTWASGGWCSGCEDEGGDMVMSKASSAQDVLTRRTVVEAPREVEEVM